MCAAKSSTQGLCLQIIQRFDLKLQKSCPTGRLKALTKSALCQTPKKPARQGSKAANKGAYMDVSDRNLQPPLTLQVKIPSNYLSFEGILRLRALSAV